MALIVKGLFQLTSFPFDLKALNNLSFDKNYRLI